MCGAAARAQSHADLRSISSDASQSATVSSSKDFAPYTDAMFTTIEGSWDECMTVIKHAVDAISAYGPRVSLVLKADIFGDRKGELTGKIQRLEHALEQLEA
mgnify:CR=1 FL=1